MNNTTIANLCQQTAFIDRVRVALSEVACEAVTATGAAVSGDPNYTRKEYARKVLRDPEYYVTRGLLPMALGFKAQEDLSEESVSDEALKARAQGLLASLA